mmetsp:Transcript_56257/g.163033  ORF Transcript_56257/g.163033 Transcript_56257/m.163033 type:complete len:242 (-) Transcript_56257:225-950(-)
MLHDSPTLEAPADGRHGDIEVPAVGGSLGVGSRGGRDGGTGRVSCAGGNSGIGGNRGADVGPRRGRDGRNASGRGVGGRRRDARATRISGGDSGLEADVRRSSNVHRPFQAHIGTWVAQVELHLAVVAHEGQIRTGARPSGTLDEGLLGHFLHREARAIQGLHPPLDGVEVAGAHDRNGVLVGEVVVVIRGPPVRVGNSWHEWPGLQRFAGQRHGCDRARSRSGVCGHRMPQRRHGGEGAC